MRQFAINAGMMLACGVCGLIAKQTITVDAYASHFAAGSSAYIFLVALWFVIGMQDDE